MAKHFNWISTIYWRYYDNKEKFNKSMDLALEEMKPEKQAKADYADFAALKEKSEKELRRKDNVKTLSVGDKKVNVLLAELDFDEYGTRINKSIRDVLKEKGADFCMLWRTNGDDSVSLLVPEQRDKETEKLWTRLQNLAGTWGMFLFGELSVTKEGWEQIEKTLERQPADCGPAKQHGSKPYDRETNKKRAKSRKPKMQRCNATDCGQTGLGKN
eukprot:GHVS01072500.1.p1 GENE.GHVS01072500.1~~GHVS01072500.1.p1  ORF type:complete len:215 (-),score=30.14 GHVS01072500.1:154-798(-)